MSENFTKKSFDQMVSFIVDELITSISVGSGLKDLSESDNDLDEPIYSTSVDSSNVSISTTSNVGEIEASISLAGGTEVDPGDEITEFGLFDSNDDMMYRTVREPVEISDGERITFTFKISVVNT